MKTVVIYHRADFDGLFSREIAKRHFGDRAEYVGWDYGDPVPDVAPDTLLYMIDISVEQLMGHPLLVWIDHHKSAIEKYDPLIVGYRIDGVAACRLAWQWFKDTKGDIHCSDEHLPELYHFVHRKVDEPMAVRLAGEYDIWDKRDPRADLFQHGLRSCELIPSIWDCLLGRDTSDIVTVALLKSGEVLAYAKKNENASVIRNGGFTVEFEGLTFLACNAARYNSFLFEGAIEDKHDALLGFNYDGEQWRVSLYHAPGKEHHDLSLIAAKFGGGGHRGACGFKLDTPVFIK